MVHISAVTTTGIEDTEGSIIRASDNFLTRRRVVHIHPNHSVSVLCYPVGIRFLSDLQSRYVIFQYVLSRVHLTHIKCIRIMIFVSGCKDIGFHGVPCKSICSHLKRKDKVSLVSPLHLPVLTAKTSFDSGLFVLRSYRTMVRSLPQLARIFVSTWLNLTVW